MVGIRRFFYTFQHPSCNWFGKPIPSPHFFLFFFRMTTPLYPNWGKSLASIALLVSALLLNSNAQAQVDTYQFTPSSGTFTPLVGGTPESSIQSDDALSGTLPLGFSFTFDGTAFTECKVSSNGWLTFNTAAFSNSLSNDLDNGSADERPRVAPFWDDLNGSNGTASYATTGTAGSRVFTFEWLNWTRYGNSGGPSFSMQVQLVEGTNVVRFVYRQESGAISNAEASIGLSGISTGTCSSFLSLSTAVPTPTTSSTVESDTISIRPATGQIYSFAPTAPAACPIPRCLTANPVTATGATLGWSASGTATSTFTVIYGLTGFNPATGGTTLTGLTSTSTAITGLTPGTTYDFYVTQICGGSAGSSPMSGVASFTTPPPPPANDDCAGAIDVPIQYGTTCIGQNSADNTAATASVGVPDPGCASYQGGDLWFKTTVPVSGAVTVRTLTPAAGSNITDTGLAVYSGTCGNLTLVDCDDDGAGSGAFSLLDLTGRTPGEVLYIRVWEYGGGTSGLIAVCVTSPSNCPLPLNPAATNLTNTTADLSWTPGAALNPGDTFEIEYGLSGFVQGSGTALNGLTTASTQLTGLLPDTEYCFYVRQNCGPTNGSSSFVGPTCFITPLTAPTNDEPCGALALSPTATTATTIGATTSGQAGILLPACSPAAAPKDVWFSFTLTSGATSTVLTLAGTAAGMVRLFTTADCFAGPLTPVANGCQAASTNNVGFPTPLTFTGLIPGQRYYVAVSGFGSSDNPGAFTLSASNTVLSARALAETDALLVYPNPSATGQLTLRLAPGHAAGQATLLNALGQAVRSAIVGTATEQTLSTRALAPGLYTLRIQLGQQTLTRKVVLQ
jgi:hypothetical protein